MTERFANVADRFAKFAFPSDTWKEVTATVQSSTYHPARLFDVNAEDYRDMSFFVIGFSYTVHGELFVDQYERSEPLEVGNQIVILYNPLKPHENNLSGIEKTASYRITRWIIGAIFAGIIIYLSEHFGWSEYGR